MALEEMICPDKLCLNDSQPITDRLEKKEGELIIPPEGFFVEGSEGPLKEGELDRAADWAKQIMATL